MIANAGFIRQYAEDGKKLNPSHVSAFGGLTSVGFVLGQLAIPHINDRFGRKWATYAFLVTLAIVRLPADVRGCADDSRVQ